MKAGEETYFGDKNTFAIRCVPMVDCEYTPALPACCHLVLGGQIIGNPNEPCFIGTWLKTIEYQKEYLEKGFLSLKSGAFEIRSDEELYNLIWQANKYTEEFDPAIADDFWPLKRCQLNLDETTEGYWLAGTECDGFFKFIWETESVANQGINSVTLPTSEVINTLETAIVALRSEFAEILAFWEAERVR
jgi:hypothetical protein